MCAPPGPYAVAADDADGSDEHMPVLGDNGGDIIIFYFDIFKCIDTENLHNKQCIIHNKWKRNEIRSVNVTYGVHVRT